jgi:hypothetical membrane protein
MVSEKRVWLRISGICGIITPLVTYTFILLAVASYPQFSWADDALSDLGVVTGITATLFNFGLIAGGILALLFALGLFTFLREKMLGRIGAFIFVLDSLALIAIGVFPENVKPMHFCASVLFFALFPISMLMVGAAFLSMARAKMGLLTILSALFVATVWITQFWARFVSGVAIAETLSALSGSMWSVVLGFKMAGQAPHSNE